MRAHCATSTTATPPAPTVAECSSRADGWGSEEERLDPYVATKASSASVTMPSQMA